MLFPHIASIVAVTVVWQFLYNAKSGPINQILRSIGIANPPSWLSDQKTALLAVMIMIIWKGIGYYMITYLAGLRGIPKDQYEAATVDGANAWEKLIYVTVPNLRPVTFYATIMCIINSFQVFTPIYVMTKGGPGRATRCSHFRFNGFRKCFISKIIRIFGRLQTIRGCFSTQ